ncbi:MAG TPA: hypothetical protein VF747_10230 [Blastocatellia bacterium]|jgi:hypothetical protein
MKRFLMISILSLPLVAAGQQPVNPKLEIYKHWDDACRSLKNQWDDPGLWFQLLESLKHDPPEYVTGAQPDQLMMVDELIKLSEKQLEALKKMREAMKK